MSDTSNITWAAQDEQRAARAIDYWTTLARSGSNPSQREFAKQEIQMEQSNIRKDIIIMSQGIGV